MIVSVKNIGLKGEILISLPNEPALHTPKGHGFLNILKGGAAHRPCGSDVHKSQV
jgi:hypothetical protein